MFRRASLWAPVFLFRLDCDIVAISKRTSARARSRSRYEKVKATEYKADRMGPRQSDHSYHTLVEVLPGNMRTPRKIEDDFTLANSSLVVDLSGPQRIRDQGN